MDKIISLDGTAMAYHHSGNYFLVISLLFMMKLLFSFAVDHYHQTDTVEC